CYPKEPPNIETSLNTLQTSHCRDHNQMNCIVPPYYSAPMNEFNMSSNALHALVEDSAKDLQSHGSNLSGLFENKNKDKNIPQDIQGLIYALQTGGSRCKMEAAITVRSLATSHHILQLALIEAGAICPLVNLLKYKAEEGHWPPELREKATITIRAEAALALASLSVSNDDNKDVIGAAGAIPLLCELIHFNGKNCNPIINVNYNSQEMAPFLILAQDAGTGALSCLSKSERNKEEIINTGIIPILIYMIDEGTSFGRAAAANVISKLASGKHADNNRIMLGCEFGTIASLVRLLKNGSSKAKETAAEALENLALNDWNKTKIVEEGGIECLMQLLENGTSKEQEAASAALKNIKSSILCEEIQQKGTNMRRNYSSYNVEQLEQPIKNMIGHVKDIENGELCKSMGYENKQLIQEKEVTSNVASTTTMDELPHSNNHIYGNLQMSKGPHLWQRNFLKKKLDVHGMQSISTSELTSTLAPPLLGQPSMQVDALLENTKKPLESNISSKRMKMTIPHIQENHNSNIPPKRNNILIESKFQNCNQPTIDSMQMKYSKTNTNNLDQVLWNRSREIFQQKNQCLLPNEGYGLADTIRDQQTKQCLVIDNQLVAGGIVALVNALSSPNPSAQEFSALALMLLASQGGFEVKTAISDAGAIPLLIAMVESSIYPMIRESAAAAIAKLVSYHPVNRARVLKAGGIKSIVNMARWSTTLIEDSSSVESLKARVQAAAIVAILNIGNVQDKQNAGMGLQDALPVLIHMLESEDFNELEASVGGLQALSMTLCSIGQSSEVKNLACRDQRSLQTTNNGNIAIEMITVLLYLIKSSSRYAKAAALEALSGFRQNLNGNRLKLFESQGGLCQQDTTKSSQLQEYTRQDGIHALSLMLEKCPTSARECITAAFASAMASDKLSVYAMDEGTIIQRLMVILEEGPTMATRVSAAASIATIGARKKRLDALSKDHILLLLQILTSNEYESGDWEGLQNYSSNATENLSIVCLMPYLLLREHITAIIVYIALSGDSKKQILIDVGTAPILVEVLRGCLFNTHDSDIQGSSQNMQSMSKNRGGINGVPPYLHATQEFATMGIIMLADKSQETIEKIVETGGISLLVKMLTATMGCKGKLGANWSEMAAAALLTLAGSNNARDEIVRVGGIGALVQVLKGEGGAIGFSLTGLAALAQLLGILGLNNEGNKLRMAEEGAIQCLVDILVGGTKYCNQSLIEVDNEQKLGFVALTQEAAAAALATLILHCRTNAEVVVQAGAIDHLVRLLGPLTPNCNRMYNLETPELRPSAYKSLRNEINFTRNKVVLSNHNLEYGDSKMNTIIRDEDLIQGGSRIGGPLAAMAALGNMVSCYPPCWREIVDAGAVPRLANLLQDGTWMHSSEVNNESLQLEEYNVHPTKLQESAALILDLLIDCEENNC
ncbi:hypothetical protein M758_12G143400, partial [Ceratodon purpureus]